MNLIDFHVTKIICEEKGKIYELYNKTLEEANDEENLKALIEVNNKYNEKGMI